MNVHDSILWGDTTPTGTGSELVVRNGADLTVSYSVLEGGCGAIDQGSAFSVDCVAEPNVLDLDPLFIDPLGCDGIACTDDEDYRLRCCSPAIDAGDNNLVLPDFTDLDGNGNTSEPTPLDLNMNPRFVDQPATTDTGNGTPPIVDMGAYELQCACPATPTIDTSIEPGYAKNRHISVLPGNPGDNLAIRFSLVQSDLFPNAMECPPRQWWVDQPVQVCENSGQNHSPPCAPSPGPPQRWFWHAPATCGEASAHYTDWADLKNYCTRGGESCDPGGPNTCALGTCGVDGVVHIYGQPVVPSSIPVHNNRTVYEVQTIRDTCDPSDEGHYSCPLVVQMPHWGDIVDIFDGTHWTAPDGVIEVATDVTAVLDKFSNEPGAPIKTRSDVEPEVVDRKVGIPDVVKVLGAFQGTDYPFSEPCDCPCP